MSSWYEQAKEKLEAESKRGKFDRFANVMKKRVLEKLIYFCQQNEEFAQAVAQGGTFEDCMKCAAKEAGKFGNGGIPDEVAYQHVVDFYFPGAKVNMQLWIQLEPDAEPQDTPDGGGILLDFSDFW